MEVAPGRPQDLQVLSAEGRHGSGVGRERPHLVDDRLGVAVPPDDAVLGPELRRVRGPGIVLRAFAKRPGFEAVEGVHQQPASHGGEPRAQRPGVVLGKDGLLGLEENGTSVHAGIHPDRGHPRRRQAFHERPLDRRGPSELGKEREVHVDRGDLRQLQDRLRQDLAVGHHNQHVGVRCCQGVESWTRLDRLELTQRKLQCRRRLRDRRRGETAPSPRWARHARGDQLDRMIRIRQRFQDGNGPPGVPQKDRSHPGASRLGESGLPGHGP